MDERGDGEPEGPRERRRDGDAAELGALRPKFRERGCESAQARRFARSDDHGWQSGDVGAAANGRGDTTGRDDVRGMDGEREPQELVGARARGRGGRPAEPADFPGVDGGVDERAARDGHDEDARITSRRKMFEHRVVDSCRASRGRR